MKKTLINLAIGGLLGFILGITQLTAWAQPQAEAVKEAKAYLTEKKIAVPRDVKKACEKAGKKYQIAPELLEAIAWRESRYVEKAISKDCKCKGLCQINTRAHSERIRRLKVTDIYDIDGNVLVAADLLAELLEETDDIALALDRYHGDKRAEAMYKRGELSDYAEQILKVSHALELVNE